MTAAHIVPERCSITSAPGRCGTRSRSWSCQERSTREIQGALYLSNLGLTPSGNEAVASDSWLAQSFRTGTNAAGYVLNSFQLLLDQASGSPSGFTVSVYSDLTLGTSLGSLSGSTDPSSGGVVTYTASDITLLPSTSYSIVVTATTSIAQGYYNWSTTSLGGTAGVDGWLMTGRLSSTNGSDWNLESRVNPFQMAIYATAIPEPAMLALAALGLTTLSFWRRKL